MRNFNRIEEELKNQDMQERRSVNPYQNVVEELKQSIGESDQRKLGDKLDDQFINLEDDLRFPQYNKLLRS